MTIEIVGLQHIDAVWPSIADGFHACVKRCGDDMTSGELWQMCRSGGAFLLVAIDDGKIEMSTIVQFQKWADGPVLRVMAMAGKDPDRWRDELSFFLEAMMRTGGAERIVSEARDGWTKVLPADARKLRSTYVWRP